MLQRRIPEDFEVNANNLPIPEGKVHFIRQVKENGTISVLNEDFDVGESLVHEYVWATIRHKTGTDADLISREEQGGGGSYQDL
jgi:5-methylcytosine-specific restriction endonuclease McrBC regulatory subunit McrC